MLTRNHHFTGTPPLDTVRAGENSRASASEGPSAAATATASATTTATATASATASANATDNDSTSASRCATNDLHNDFCMSIAKKENANKMFAVSHLEPILSLK